MSRNIKYQIHTSVEASFCPSQGKHMLKEQGVTDFGERIFSYSSMNRLKDVGSDFANFIKQNYPQIKLVKEIKSVHCEAFLKAKLDSGCTANTVKTYAQSLQKLGKCCLYRYGEGTQIDWKTDKNIYQNNIKLDGQTAKIRTLTMDKTDFDKAIERGRDCQSKEALKVCWAFGLRSEEVVSIRACDVKKDSLIVSNAKGGRTRELSADTHEKREALARLNELKYSRENVFLSDKVRLFTIKKNSVNDYLQTNLRRAEITKYNDAKTGIHSIRKAFASREYERYRAQGLSHRESWGKVSNELGHGKDRMELFKIYVGK